MGRLVQNVGLLILISRIWSSCLNSSCFFLHCCYLFSDFFSWFCMCVFCAGGGVVSGVWVYSPKDFALIRLIVDSSFLKIIFNICSVCLLMNGISLDFYGWIIMKNKTFGVAMSYEIDWLHKHSDHWWQCHESCLSKNTYWIFSCNFVSCATSKFWDM